MCVQRKLIAIHEANWISLLGQVSRDDLSIAYFCFLYSLMSEGRKVTYVYTGFLCVYAYIPKIKIADNIGRQIHSLVYHD